MAWTILRSRKLTKLLLANQEDGMFYELFCALGEPFLGFLWEIVKFANIFSL